LVADDFVAWDYETTRLSIEECRTGALQPIDPAHARDLQRYAPAGLGQPAHMQDKTRRRIELAARLELKGLSKRQAAKQLFPEPESDADAAYTKTKNLYRDRRQEIAVEKARLGKGIDINSSSPG
jgi:hypothetical protein